MMTTETEIKEACATEIKRLESIGELTPGWYANVLRSPSMMIVSVSRKSDIEHLVNHAAAHALERYLVEYIGRLV